MHFAPFFFFFSFEFRPESVSAEMVDSGPSRPDSTQIGPSKSRVSASRRESTLKKKPRVMMRRDAAGCAGSGIPASQVIHERQTDMKGNTS